MNDFDSKQTMDTIELNPFLGLPMSIFPRYPPGVLPPTNALMNQKRLKEKFLQENASMTTALPPGHPFYSRLNSSTLLKNENDKLRKENLELKNRLVKKQKTEN
jgi:hypothetical protein